MREQAWQLDGWADTVSKVRFGSLFPQSMLALTDARRASCAADGADGEVHGLVRDGPALVQPAQVTRNDVCARGSSTMQCSVARRGRVIKAKSVESLGCSGILYYTSSISFLSSISLFLDIRSVPLDARCCIACSGRTTGAGTPSVRTSSGVNSLGTVDRCRSACMSSARASDHD